MVRVGLIFGPVVLLQLVMLWWVLRCIGLRMSPQRGMYWVGPSEPFSHMLVKIAAKWSGVSGDRQMEIYRKSWDPADLNASVQTWLRKLQWLGAFGALLVASWVLAGWFGLV